MTVRKVNEGTACYVTAKFRNNGATVVPLSVRYRVECLTTRRTMLDWTDVSPASSVTVTIPASLNVLNKQTNSRERRQVIFEANYGTDTAFTNARAYDVENLQGIE